MLENIKTFILLRVSDIIDNTHGYMMHETE